MNGFHYSIVRHYLTIPVAFIYKNLLVFTFAQLLFVKRRGFIRRFSSKKYKKLSFLIGKQVQVFPIIDDAKSSYTATVLDIDNNANLVVQANGKTEVLNSGEISLKI